jgi:tetratricopeptide (TPR) repeat protein
MYPGGRLFTKTLLRAVCAAAVFFYAASSGAETLDGYYTKGAEKYRMGEINQAMDSWLRGLDEARRKGDKNWTGAFLSGLGIAYQGAGDMQKAVEYYTQALEYKKETGDRMGEAQTLQNVAYACQSLGQYEKALEYYNRSHRIRMELGDKPGQADCLSGMAGVYLKLRDYPKAVDYFNRTAALKKTVGDTAGEVAAVENLAEIYRDGEQYRKSLDYYLRALILKRAAGDIAGEKKLLLIIAELYADVSDYAKALYHYNRLLKAASETDDGKAEADAYSGIGRVYKTWKDNSRALYYLDRAIKTNGETETARRATALDILDIHIEQGTMDAARRFVSKFDDPIVLARYHLANKEYAKARGILLEFIPKAEKNGQPDALLAAYTAMGLAEEAIKNYEAAFGFFEKAFGAAESMFMSLDEFQKRGFFRKKNPGFARIEPYEGLVRTARPSGLTNAAALYYSEYAKNRMLWAYKNSADEMHLPSQITEAKFYGIPIAIDAGDRIPTDAGDRIPIDAGDRIPIDAGDRIPACEVVLAYEVMEPYTRLFVIGRGAFVRAIDIGISRGALSDLVRKYTAALEDAAAGRVKYDPAAGRELYDLLVRPALEQVMGDAIPRVNGDAIPRVNGDASPRANGGLAAGVNDNGAVLIPPSARLVIVPDEMLRLLPFESLVAEVSADFAVVAGGNGPVQPGLIKYLGDEHDVIYHHSVSSLIAQRSPGARPPASVKKGGGLLAVFAARDEAAADSAARSTNGAYRIKNTGVLADRHDPGGQWLLGGAKKASAADRTSAFDRLALPAVIFSGKAFKDMQVDALYGPALNEEELKGKDLTGYRFLLFSADAVTDDPRAYARQPALIINEQTPGAPQDGVLTLGEVMDFKLNAENVVLLSVNSGKGRSLDGEQASYLAEAFRSAGAGSVLVVNLRGAPQGVAPSRKISSIFLDAFYARLMEGRTAVEALRAARSELRKAGYDNPAFWSRFILAGW